MNNAVNNGDDGIWSGTWVAERLGVELVGDDTLTSLLGLALRRNPKRAHLLVSNVLGKHVPQSPSVVHGHGFALGRRVRELLGAEEAAEAVVLGYAETATGLGHSVADGIGTAPCLHSTRRPVAGVAQAGGFEESHSHATSHLLLPEDPALLVGSGPLVLVDDEFSTGNTVLNTIRALHERYPRGRYVVVALVDMRSAADAGRLDDFAREIGARVDLVTTASGTVLLPEGCWRRARSWSPGTRPRPPRAVPGRPRGRRPRCRRAWRPTRGAIRQGRGELRDRPRRTRTRTTTAPGRRGPRPPHPRGPALAARPSRRRPARLHPRAPDTPGRGPARDGRTPGRGVAARRAERPRARLRGADVRPLRLARELEQVVGAEVRYSTTTRSPVLAVDDPGYAIRSRIVFPAHDDPADGPGERYAYNVAGGDFDAVVAVVDSVADTRELHAPDGLLSQLAAHTPHVVLAVVPSYVPEPLYAAALSEERPAMLPEPLRGPAFSSYPPEEVGWLLQDLSDVTLEAPTEEREEAIQSGGAHYAESLPVEYQPSEQYQELFHAALETSAARIAQAVGVVTETVITERSPGRCSSRSPGQAPPSGC